MTTKLRVRPRAAPAEIAPAETAPAETGRSQMDRLFDGLREEILSSFWPAYPFAAVAGTRDERSLPFLPALSDIEDRGQAYEIHTDLPGVPKDQIDIRVNGNVLSIRAESTQTTGSDGKSYVRRERTYQGFQRVFELPEPVLSEKIEAHYKDGTLRVTVPKANPVPERKISVN